MADKYKMSHRKEMNYFFLKFKAKLLEKQKHSGNIENAHFAHNTIITFN